MNVRAKKGLGQHFLKDEHIAKKIVESLHYNNNTIIIEIGPGTGVLTKFLLQKENDLKLIEIDTESIAYLKKHYPQIEKDIIAKDFLQLDLSLLGQKSMQIIGNFPYYISSQIFFKILDYRHLVQETVCMIQREVARRIAAQPGSKEYGILSVLLQAFYSIDYLFTVNEHVFSPPPKVKSAVIRLQRNNAETLPCNEKLFRKVVKATFNQRRKTIRNSLKSILLNLNFDDQIVTFRPEQLTIEQFIELTNLIEQHSEQKGQV